MARFKPAGIARAVISGGWQLRTLSRVRPEVSSPQFRLLILVLRPLVIIGTFSLRTGFAIRTLLTRTSQPIEHDLVSVTVVHPSTMIADAWATALMIVGTEGITIGRYP